MKIVKMTRDMRPYRGGQDAVLDDETADRLVANKEASDPRPYPPPDVAPAVPVGEKEKPALSRHKGYFTRGGNKAAGGKR